MRHNSLCRIGVIAYSQGEMGRAILRGASSFCRANKAISLHLLSDKGYYPDVTRKVAGMDVVLAQDARSDHLIDLRKYCANTISLSNQCLTKGVTKVLNDDIAIGELGAQYLFSRGFRTFAFLEAGWFRKGKVSPFLFSRERAEGFLKQLRPTGLPVHHFPIAAIAQTPSILAALQKIPGRVGVMTSSDLYAQWLLNAIPNPEKHIPHQLGILGVDDDPLINALAPVPLSSIHPAGERLGFEAARLGFDLFTGKRTGCPEIRIAPSHLQTRTTTDIFAVEDALVAKTQRWIWSHLSHIGDVSDIIVAMGIPRRTLEAKFHHHIGRGIAAELLQARITRATELLGTTSLTISEIAHLVGFSESRLLSRNFRKLTGETPGQYRSRIKPL